MSRQRCPSLPGAGRGPEEAGSQRGSGVCGWEPGRALLITQGKPQTVLTEHGGVYVTWTPWHTAFHLWGGQLGASCWLPEACCGDELASPRSCGGATQAGGQLVQSESPLPGFRWLALAATSSISFFKG